MQALQKNAFLLSLYVYYGSLNAWIYNSNQVRQQNLSIYIHHIFPHLEEVAVCLDLALTLVNPSRSLFSWQLISAQVCPPPLKLLFYHPSCLFLLPPPHPNHFCNFIWYFRVGETAESPISFYKQCSTQPSPARQVCLDVEQKIVKSLLSRRKILGEAHLQNSHNCCDSHQRLVECCWDKR